MANVNERLFCLHRTWLAGDGDGERMNLSGQDLRGVDISGRNLTKAIFQETWFSAGNLRSVWLKEADLEGAMLWGVEGSNARMNRAVMSSSNCEGANFAGGDFTQIQAVNARWNNIRLDEATMTGAKVIFSNLQNATLDRADLSNANFMFTNFDGASLRGAIVIGTDFRGAKLPYAVLRSDFETAKAILAQAKTDCGQKVRLAAVIGVGWIVKRLTPGIGMWFALWCAEIAVAT